MSTLTKLDLLPSYHKGENDIATEFYCPCMESANKYDRAVGFFSSSIYIIAWDSLKTFISNEGNIRIICSPYLNKKDIEAIDTGYKNKVEAHVGVRIAEEIENLLKIPELEKPTKVLASLVSMGIIDFRIAYVDDVSQFSTSRLFHDKVGIFTDFNDNSVVFKGSMNETFLALSSDGNIESVDVYLSWGDKRDRSRVNQEIDYFENIWTNKYPSIISKPFPLIAVNKLRSISE